MEIWRESFGEKMVRKKGWSCIMVVFHQGLHCVSSILDAWGGLEKRGFQGSNLQPRATQFSKYKSYLFHILTWIFSWSLDPVAAVRPSCVSFYWSPHPHWPPGPSALGTDAREQHSSGRSVTEPPGTCMYIQHNPWLNSILMRHLSKPSTYPPTQTLHLCQWILTTDHSPLA